MPNPECAARLKQTGRDTMIQSFDEIQTPDTLSTDLCIIGSGAAGITIANEFLKSGIDVIVLAGGNRRLKDADQDLYRSTIVGLPHEGTHSGRVRMFGGTTTVWGGQALPLNDIDFERRSWVAHSGWPIERTELAPYYLRAKQALQLSQLDFDAPVWEMFGIEPPAFDPSCLVPVFSQWCPRPNFAVVHQKALRESESVRVLLDAHAVELRSNSAASSVERVIIKSLSGKAGSIQAKHHVICSGGIDTARLLLASRSVEPRGLGNKNDLVGRFFQDHVAVTFAQVQPRRRSHLQELYDQFYWNRSKLQPKIALSAPRQREAQVLNAVSQVTFATPPASAIVAAKELLLAIKTKRSVKTGVLWNILKGADDVTRLAYRYWFQNRAFSPKDGPIHLEAHCEQEPDPNSRVSLGSAGDALGMPRAQIDWRVTDLSKKTVAVLHEMIRSEFRRLDVGNVIALDVLSDDAAWCRKMSDVNHHIGTTRMADDCRHGVVNRHCQVHGVDNLHVGSSAVFPTGGYANPTLTTIALCLRLCDRLKAMLA